MIKKKRARATSPVRVRLPGRIEYGGAGRHKVETRLGPSKDRSKDRPFF